MGTKSQYNSNKEQYHLNEDGSIAFLDDDSITILDNKSQSYSEGAEDPSENEEPIEIISKDDEINDDVNTIKKEMVELKSSVEQIKKSVSNGSSNGDAAAVKTQVDRLDGAVSSLLKLINGVDGKVGSLEKIKKEVQQLEASANNLIEYILADDGIKKKLEQLSQMHSELQQLVNGVDGNNANLGKLKSHIEQMEKAIESLSKAICSNEMEKKLTELSGAQSRLQDLIGVADNNIERIKSLYTQIETLEKSVKSLNSSLDDMKGDDGEFADVKAQVGQLMSLINQARTDILSKQNAFDKQLKNLTDSQAQLKKTLDVINGDSGKLANVKSQVEKLGAAVAQLRNDILPKRDDLGKQLKSLTDSQKQLTLSLDEIIGNKGRLTAIKTRIEELGTNIYSLSAQLEAIKKESDERITKAVHDGMSDFAKIGLIRVAQEELRKGILQAFGPKGSITIAANDIVKESVKSFDKNFNTITRDLNEVKEGLNAVDARIVENRSQLDKLNANEYNFTQKLTAVQDNLDKEKQKRKIAWQSNALNISYVVICIFCGIFVGIGYVMRIANTRLLEAALSLAIIPLLVVLVSNTIAWICNEVKENLVKVKPKAKIQSDNNKDKKYNVIRIVYHIVCSVLVLATIAISCVVISELGQLILAA